MNIENKLKQKNLKCSGCTACFAICPKDAITMQADLEGFKYPVIDKNKCIDCGLCCKVCPLENIYGNFGEDKHLLHAVQKMRALQNKVLPEGYLPFWRICI